MASLELNAGTNFILVILIIGGINWLVTMLRLGTTYGFSGAEQAWASHPRDALSWIGDYIKKSGGGASLSLLPQVIIYLIVGICAIILCFMIAHAHTNSSKKESFGGKINLKRDERDAFEYCSSVAYANDELWGALSKFGATENKPLGDGGEVNRWLATNTTGASNLKDFANRYNHCATGLLHNSDVSWGGGRGPKDPFAGRLVYGGEALEE
jgi:uncharacterized membrane protein YuzA (DUF378 family)